MRKILNLLRGRRARLESDLDRELRYHFDRRVDDLRAEGRREDDARRQAAIEMGGIEQVQEDVRETWTLRWLDDAARDVRYAARSLACNPGFTATAVLSLAIGVGASAAIFSLVDQVLFRLLPVREPERLVAVDWKGNNLSNGWGPGAYMSYPLCRDLMKQDRFFDGVLCRFPTGVMLASGEGRPAEPVGAEIVSGSYFPVLGVAPAAGRLLDEQDDVQPGAHPVVVLSYAYWQSVLGGAPDVVGRKVLLNGFPMTVVGVASPRFRGMDIGEVPAVWIPASMKAQATPEWDRLLDRRAGFMQVFGRLRPGVGADEAQAGLQPWFKAMLDEDTRREGFPNVTAEQRAQFLASTISVRPAPLGRSSFRQRMDRPLVVLMAGTLLLLLLASLNVASLFLARAAARAREIRTRIALGASRVRIATLLLADSLLVALAGGALGLVVAPLVSRSLLSFLPQEAAGVDLSPAMDGRVFVFAFSVSALAGVLCGMAPAWQAGRVSLIGSLKQRWSG
ncbi:MAG TPA: ABC transporter permease, partial [Vicinamibacteria bacterium]